MKPVLVVNNGELLVQKKVIGSMYRAIDYMAKQLVEQEARVDLDYIIIMQSLANNQAIYLKNLIKNKFGSKVNIVNIRAGCVISKHCGPGTIGIHYIIKGKR